MVIDQSFIGAPVYDMEGHEIGTVKEIAGDAFKVDVPLRFDYWLHIEAVDSADVGRIVLTVDQDHLNQFKVDSPREPVATDDPSLRENESPVGGSSTSGVTDWAAASPRFHDDWEEQHSTMGAWEEFEPGYQFGYEMAHDPRFEGRSWDDAEPELRSLWAGWDGRPDDLADASWERAGWDAHRAWDSVREDRQAA